MRMIIGIEAIGNPITFGGFLSALLRRHRDPPTRWRRTAIEINAKLRGAIVLKGGVQRASRDQCVGGDDTLRQPVAEVAAVKLVAPVGQRVAVILGQVLVFVAAREAQWPAANPNRRSTEHLDPGLVIDRATIVRIYKAQIPELCPLIKIWHGWKGQLQHGLYKAVVDAKTCDPFLKGQKHGEKSVGQPPRLVHPCEQAYNPSTTTIERDFKDASEARSARSTERTSLNSTL